MTTIIEQPKLVKVKLLPARLAEEKYHNNVANVELINNGHTSSTSVRFSDETAVLEAKQTINSTTPHKDPEKAQPKPEENDQYLAIDPVKDGIKCPACKKIRNDAMWNSIRASLVGKCCCFSAQDIRCKKCGEKLERN